MDVAGGAEGLLALSPRRQAAWTEPRAQAARALSSKLVRGLGVLSLLARTLPFASSKISEEAYRTLEKRANSAPLRRS